MGKVNGSEASCSKKNDDADRCKDERKKRMRCGCSGCGGKDGSNSDINKQSIIVLLSTIACNVFVGINFVSFAAYYVVLTRYFNVSKATAGWAGSIQVCMQQAGGLFVAPLIEKYGSRRMARVGSCVAFVGILLSAFASNIYVLYLTFGLITGSGLSVMTLVKIVEIQQVFSRNRALAQGLSFFGLSIGSVCGTFVIVRLLETFGWRGTMMVHSAIILHLIPVSAGFRRKGGVKSDEAQSKSADDKVQVVVAKEDDGAKSSDDGCKNTNIANSNKHGNQKETGKRSYVKQIMDCSVLNNGLFCLYVVAHSTYSLGSSGYNAHLPSWAVASGYTLEQGAALVASTSLGILVGRLPFALISNTSVIDVTLMASLLASLAGIASVAMPVVLLYGPAVGVCIFQGLLQAGLHPLFPTILSQQFGAAGIARFQAVSGLFTGFAVLCSVPLAGFVYDQTSNYNLSLILLGLIKLLGGLLMGVLFIVVRCRAKHAGDGQAEMRSVEDINVGLPVKIYNDDNDLAVPLKSKDISVDVGLPETYTVASASETDDNRLVNAKV